MNTEIRLLALLLAFGASSASAAKDAKTSLEPVYDPATVVDVKVTVIGIREAPMTEPLNGLHLTVKTDTEAFDIYVGPTDFVKIFEITFAKGDKIQVVGSKVSLTASISCLPVKYPGGRQPSACATKTVSRSGSIRPRRPRDSLQAVASSTSPALERRLHTAEEEVLKS